MNKPLLAIAMFAYVSVANALDLDENCQPTLFGKMSLLTGTKNQNRNWWNGQLQEINRDLVGTPASRAFDQQMLRQEAADRQYDREVEAAERRRADASGETAMMREVERSLSPQARRQIQDANREMARTSSSYSSIIASITARLARCKAHVEEQIRRLE